MEDDSFQTLGSINKTVSWRCREMLEKNKGFTALSKGSDL